MKKITSVTHAQEVLGTQIDFEKLPEVLKSVGFPGKDIAPLTAQYQLWLITEANNKLNGWNNKKHDPSQLKFSIWAPDIVENKERPSGFGLAFSSTLCWHTHTSVGARLEVGSREEAKYIFEDFIELYNVAWLFQEE